MECISDIHYVLIVGITMVLMLFSFIGGLWLADKKKKKISIVEVKEKC